jgi:hypothetical protein
MLRLVKGVAAWSGNRETQAKLETVRTRKKGIEWVMAIDL